MEVQREMYLIAGLGNPTAEYEHTRHNMGFDCIDILAGRLGVKMKKSRFGALVGKGQIGGEQVLLVKPLTFMNLSGNAVAPIAKYYKIDTHSNLIIIYDDSDMDVGRIRIRKKGSAGGHNGMKSIIGHLGHDEFLRIRIGIGRRPDQMEMVDYVLGHIPSQERKLIDEALTAAADAARDIVEHGADHAMNNYN